MKMKPTILTHSGVYFDFLDPKPETVLIEDIAHALSRICRFNGHTRLHYSVAQHSVLVSHLVPPEDALYGLLHDAAEAYIGDVATPLKQLLPEYKVIERRVETAVLARFGMDLDSMPESIKRADLRMLATEQRDLLPKHPDVWACLAGVEPLDYRLKPETSRQAKRNFLTRYRELTTGEGSGSAPS